MNQMRWLSLILIFFIIPGLWAREKTEKIGNYVWLTEKNTWEEILKEAQKTNKPILAVFSAEWCDPCVELKQSVYPSKEFKQVADSVVLFYIEQASKEGDAYCSKFNVKIFPTFKLFSKDGIMLDNGTFKRNVAGFLGWIKEVKSGNSYYELSKKLEKNPNDCELMVRLVERMGMSDKREKLPLLEKIIAIKPDFKDDIAQRAYEKLAVTILENVPRRESGPYIEKYRKLFQDIVNSYYPDKFKYALKGKSGLMTFFDWYLQCGENEKVISIFNDYLKQKNNKLDYLKDLDILGWVVPAYLNIGNLNEAEKWILGIKNYLKPAPGLKHDPVFQFYYPGMFRNLIFFLENKNMKKEAEKYVLMFYKEMDRMGLDSEKENVRLEYSENYKTLSDLVNSHSKK